MKIFKEQQKKRAFYEEAKKKTNSNRPDILKIIKI